MSERRFTDEEVAIILRDATETDRGARRDRDPGGLTLRQLEEIAGEVGMDPAQVRSAAGRLVLHRSGQRLPFLGTPVAPAFERVIPGALPPGELAELVATIRRTLGRRGIGSSELGAFEWRAQDVLGGRYVSVSQRGGDIRLRVFANFRDGLMLMGVGGGVLMTVAAGAVLAAFGMKEILGPGIVAASALLSALPVRALWRRAYRREEDALAELTDALDEQIRALAAPAPEGRSDPSPEPPSPPPSRP